MNLQGQRYAKGKLLFGDALSGIESTSLLHHSLHTLLGVEDLLAKADGLGSYLNKLIVGDELDSLLKREDNGRGEQIISRDQGTSNMQVCS